MFNLVRPTNWDQDIKSEIMEKISKISFFTAIAGFLFMLIVILLKAYGPVIIGQIKIYEIFVIFSIGAFFIAAVLNGIYFGRDYELNGPDGANIWTIPVIFLYFILGLVVICWALSL